MQKKFIMTAFSKDRPGIVADVTEVIYENGCNLEDTTMTNMPVLYNSAFIFFNLVHLR